VDARDGISQEPGVPAARVPEVLRVPDCRPEAKWTLITELSPKRSETHVFMPAMAADLVWGRGQLARGRAGWAKTAGLAVLTVHLFGLSRPGTAEAKDESRTITVEARDMLSDAPVRGVRLQMKLDGTQATLGQTTSASGSARFLLQDAAKPRYLRVTATREGYVPLRISWDYKTTSPTPPDRLLFQMEKATTIRGRVVDEHLEPVADATVVVWVSKRYSNSNQRAEIVLESTKSDANGRWSFANVPDAPDELEMGAYHYLFLTDQSTHGTDKAMAISALRDGSAVLRLERGTRIEGRVESPDGRPVSGAQVFYGRHDNSIPPVKTDDRGTFALGIKPGVATSLTARHSGFGPTMQAITIGREPQRITLTLTTPSTLSGRVIDPAGKPVARATIQVKSWRNSETLAHELTTGEDGRFAWNEAPSDELKVNVHAERYTSKEGVALLAGRPNEIVLTPPTAVKGTVVDGETGEPVGEFSLLVGARWQAGDGLVWLRGWSDGTWTQNGPGSFDCALDVPAHQYVIRIQANGYLPAESGFFAGDGAPQAFTFRLEKGMPIRGSVQNPDGSPARDGFVYLVPVGDVLSLVNGDVPERQREGMTRSKLSPEGRFSLPPEKGAFLLVALNDAGFAFTHRREFRENDPLRLQAWARASGTVTVDHEPVADLEISTGPGDAMVPVKGEPRVVHRLVVKTDLSGQFELPRVIPGRHVIGQWAPNGVRRRVWFVNMATIDVESGRGYNFKIGDSGRAVTGRLAIPGRGEWLVRKASIEPRFSKGKLPSIGVRVFDDGRFRAEDLAVGEYVLRVDVHEQPPDDACGWGRLIGAFTHEFSVNGKAGDVPVDLGKLQSTDVGDEPLRVGERAPSFRVKLLDGKLLSLDDFKGKFVLLDFWATWCAPCVAELPNLKAVHEAHRNDHQFAIVSLSLDEKAEDLARFVKDHELRWLQGMVGGESPVVTKYGATAIPATFLIGPDGRIIARDLRGKQAQEAVAKALRR
jgi:peroxiredoxin/protocatechuate 3,4-dioxygenase beta subunit